MDEDDDQSTCIEPAIFYSSPMVNSGVKEISKNKYNTYRCNYSVLSSHNSSVYNTIMLPFISSDGSIHSENSNKNTTNSIKVSKENTSNNYYMKFDITRNKTLSSKSDNEQKNNDSLNLNLKITQIYNNHSPNIIKRSTFISKRLSMGLPQTNYDEILNLKSHNTENNYESDNHYLKKSKQIQTNIKDSIRTTKTRQIQINEEKVPSLFLKAEKYEQKNSKNILIFKSKKRRKTQKTQIKNNKMGFKRKDKTAMFFIEKSKSYNNEEFQRNCQSSSKKNKINSNIVNAPEGKVEKTISKSNKNIKNINENMNNTNNINNEESIKKIMTTKFTLADKFKSNMKTEKKKKKKNNNDRKISFKENIITNKLVKIMFSRNTEVKNNKYESSGLKMLREQMNNRNYKEKKEDEKYKKDNKSKKIMKKSLNLKDKEKTSKENLDQLDSSERRQSGFLSKEEVMKKMFENKANYKERKLSKRDKKTSEKVINDSKKDINKLKQKDIKNDSNKNLLLTIARRKRSITLHYQNSKMHEISEALRDKLPKKIVNNTLNLNTSSTNVTTKKKKKKKLSDVEVFLKKNMKNEQYNLFTTYTNTVYTGPDFTKYIISCLELILELDKDSQVRLKTKINFNFPKPKKKGLKKRIALFDLDETLVHCTGDINTVKVKYQHLIDISLPGKNTVKVGINLRPLWKETLDLIKKKYYIVVHTASHQAYADAVLDFMDPEKKYFKYRLYRNNCSLVDIDEVKFYVKDLDIFNEYYDLKDIVIIDNSVLSFAYHLYNGIPIVPYYEGEDDNFLYVVGLYLDHIYKANDLREANKKLINLDYFYEIAKSQVENVDNIIDEESNVIEEDEENSQNNEIKEEKINTNNTKKGDETMKRKKSRHRSEKIKNETKKMLGSNSPLSTRRTVKELSENKLMSNSNLFNMYLEMNENKKLIDNNRFALTAKETLKEKSLSIINFSNYAKLVNEDMKSAEKINKKDFDCKSEPQLNHSSFVNEYLTDDENNQKNIKRVLSLVDREFLATKKKNAIMGDLNILKTNFSNKFKDLDNLSDKE